MVSFMKQLQKVRKVWNVSRGEETSSKKKQDETPSRVCYLMSDSKITVLFTEVLSL